jgi:tRNA(adenine34) deaminase
MTTRKRWVGKVTSVSTFPPKGTFTRDAGTIARIMASKKVSPKGLGSAIRMVQLFINRAGRALPAARRRELERAKRLLQKKREARKPPARGRRGAIGDRGSPTRNSS